MQDKSGIQRLKAARPLWFDTQMPNNHTGKTGGDECWGRRRLGSTRHAKYIHVGEWNAMSGTRSISGPGLRCKMSILFSSEGETRTSLAEFEESKGGFPSMASIAILSDASETIPRQLRRIAGLDVSRHSP